MNFFSLLTTRVRVWDGILAFSFPAILMVAVPA
jgi:hypothetical protein